MSVASLTAVQIAEFQRMNNDRVYASLHGTRRERIYWARYEVDIHNQFVRENEEEGRLGSVVRDPANPYNMPDEVVQRVLRQTEDYIRRQRRREHLHEIRNNLEVTRRLSQEIHIAPRLNSTVVNCTVSGGDFSLSESIKSDSDAWVRMGSNFGKSDTNFRRRMNLLPGADVSKSENKARLLLKRLIGEIEFRRYLKNGFVMYRGRSGYTYQIFPGGGATRIRHMGTPIASVCVIFTTHLFPPTDYLIMRLLLLEDSEVGFRNECDDYGMCFNAEPLPEQKERSGRILKIGTLKRSNDIRIRKGRIYRQRA